MKPFAHHTYVDNLKGYHCSTLSNVRGYMLISLLKWVDALVLLNAFFLPFPGQRGKILIFLTTYFKFDEVSLKREVKLAVICFTVRVILVGANGTRSHLDLSDSHFALWNLYHENMPIQL